MPYTITTQAALRAAFWEAHPGADRRLIRAHGTRLHCADTRVAWVDYIDALQRDGTISEALADRATLQPARRVYSWEVQANYGHGGGWETLCSGTRAEVRADLASYQENAPGVPYRIKLVSELVSRA